MVVSADDRHYSGGHPWAEPGATRSNEIAILERLISGIAGPKALAVASELIDRFGSLARLLHNCDKLSDADLALPDPLAHYLRTLSHAFAHSWREALVDRPILSTSEEVRRYLHHKMAFARKEQFRVLFLDAENKLLADDLMWEGTVNGVQIHNREVITRALEYAATAMILVHNHPSGSVSPSADDLKMTRRLVLACEPFDLSIQDHLIIAEGACYSMRLRRAIVT